MSGNSFSLYIGENYIAFIDAEKKDNVIVLKAASLVQSDLNVYTLDQEADYAKVSGQIKKMLKDAKVSKKNVNVIIPDSQNFSQIVEMPMMTEKELATAIKYHADQFIPIPIEKLSMDLEILHSDKEAKKITVMIVAATNQTVSKMGRIISMTGYSPESIESESSSALRFFANCHDPITQIEPVKKAYVIINFGFSSTSFYLISSPANMPVQIHTIPLGLEIFIKDIKANYNIDSLDIKKLLTTVGFTPNNQTYDFGRLLGPPMSELIMEVEKFITSSKQKISLEVDRLILMGEGADISDFSVKISALTGIKTDYFSPAPYLQKNSVSEFYKNKLNLFIPALGAFY